MKTGHKRQVYALSVITAFIALLALSPSTQALGFNSSDKDVNYLIVKGSPDLAKPGDTISINVAGKLAAASNVSDIFHITLYVDTTSQPSKIITEGNLILPADATEGTVQFSVAIPSDTIDNTYLYMSLSDGWRTYSKISISHIQLIQNPTYLELQNQNAELQKQNANLQSTTDTLSILFYIATFVAAIFIITTVYILFLTFRAKKNKNQNSTALVQPTTPSAESS